MATTRTVNQLSLDAKADQAAAAQQYNFISWPGNLGSVGKGDDGLSGVRFPHICAFFINENVKDQITNTNVNLSRGGTTTSFLDNVNSTHQNVVTNRISNSGFSQQVKNITGTVANPVGAGVNAAIQTTAGIANSVTGSKLSPDTITNLVSPVYKRLNLAIFLPMPMEVKHEYGVSYNDAGMEGMFGTALTALDSEGVGSAVSSGAEAFVRGTLSKFAQAGAKLMNMGESGERIFNKTLGTIENPRTEQVFDRVVIREFTFRWQFWPKSVQESEDLKTILDLFKENMLPSFRSDDNVGGFYTMPNEFDIEFYTSSTAYNEQKDEMEESLVENKNIGRISTCVLTNLTVDSTPRGQFAAFRGTGAPVSIGVTMSFKELSPLHRGMVGKGIQLGNTRFGGH